MTKDSTTIADYLGKQTNLLEKHFRKAYENPSKRNVHQLRVTLRRVRTVIWLIEHGSPRISFGKLSSSLRGLGKVLGKRRELDVALQDATRYHLKIKKLKSEIQSRQKVLIVKLNPKHQRKVLGSLKEALIKIRKHSELRLTPALNRICTRLIPWIPRLKIDDDELHEIRVIVKKARYTLEAVGRPIKPLRNLQAVLGRGHDLEVLQELTEKNPRAQSDATQYYRKAKHTLQLALRFALDQLQGR